mgnify:CR=1 FL=1
MHKNTTRSNKMQTFENYFNNIRILEEQFTNEYLSESYDILLEKLITFGGKAYPNYGHVVIMAGGAGSGKGFVKDNLIGLEGRTFDVDDLKKLAAKTPAIQKKAKEEFGVDLEDLSKDMRKAENVAKMHEIIGDALNIPDKQQQAMFKSILATSPDRKPNLIFDVTLKDLRKLEKITRQVSAIGYDKKNIHIVWVINDIEVAKDQNLKRDRTVPVDILVNTHRGVSATMQDILNMGKSLNKYMDGDIVFAFNKIKVDSEVARSDRGGSFIKDANYFYVKRAGKEVTPLDKLERDVRSKIASYVPKNVEWV